LGGQIAAAMEVNQTFNYCNEAEWLAATRTDSKGKGFSVIATVDPRLVADFRASLYLWFVLACW
jgi:hypothetical protein